MKPKTWKPKPMQPPSPQLKPLGLAVALAAAGAFTADAAYARPEVAAAERGDLALVPYYTVRGEWVTGLHIVNTSAHTQVVKLRFRRATDGMNALDFNLVMAPRDVYAGFLSDNASGAIAWTSPDTTCTVPATRGKRLEMPAIYRAGAESGTIEIIAMGAPADERQPIARAARPAPPAAGSSVSTAAAPASMPLDCAAVRSNFFADGAGTAAGATTRPGVESNLTTWQAASSAAAIEAGGRNTYVDSGDVLKVSYFIRDNATGIEFGDNAVHVSGFLAEAAITNQQYGVLSGDLNGLDFPDLNGGVPLARGPGAGAPGAAIRRGRFEALRASDALGVNRILNEWSANPANGVEMDWVLTLPGQYTMLNLPRYAAALAAGRAGVPTLGGAGRPRPNPRCPRVSTPAPTSTPTSTPTRAAAECDYRDMPVELAFTAYNREAFRGQAASGTLVPGPQPPAVSVKTYLPKVANVITFGGRRAALGASDAEVSAARGQPYGWVSARLKSVDDELRVCDWDFAQDRSAGFGAAAGEALQGALVCSSVTGAVPVIGFAAWSRRVAANPAASYGRIVEHSYERPRAPGTVFRDPLKDGGQGPQMVVLPTGNFRMGAPATEAGRFSDEGPVRAVTIGKRIAMGRYEVTFADYDRFVNAADYAEFVARFVAESGRTRPANDDDGWGRGARPVINVNWNEARAYASWLSAQTGKAYRLPSEAEWEYAARAGTTTAYSFGDSIACAQASYARFPSSSCNGGRDNALARTVAAGSFAANAFGLFDMHGNVWEWVEDCWHDNYEGAPTDGSAWTSACTSTSSAVVRGGSWASSPRNLRAAFRLRVSPSGRSSSVGIRLVQDLNP